MLTFAGVSVVVVVVLGITLFERVRFKLRLSQLLLQNSSYGKQKKVTIFFGHEIHTVPNNVGTALLSNL